MSQPAAPPAVATLSGAAASSRLRRNVVANYGAAVWLGVLSLGATPFYLRALDADQWGLVAACLTVQGLLALADIGMAQSMPRMIARATASPATLRHVWRSHAALYSLIAAVVFAVGQATAGSIAVHWLGPAGVDPAQGELALRVLLLQFLFQFTNNASIGYWLGTEQQVRASVRQCAFATARHGTAVALMAGGSDSAFAYLAPFAGWAMVECMANAAAVVRELRPTEQPRPLRAADLGRVLGDASMLTLGIAIGAAAFQLDRWVLSTSLSIDAFGRYVAIATLGLAFLQLQHPLLRAFLPRLSALHVLDPDAVRPLVRRLLATITACCLLPCALAIVVAEPLLRLWIGDAGAAAQGAATLRLILAAMAVNAAYGVIYQLILARRADRVVVVINSVVLLVVLAVIGLAERPLAPVTGGVIWLAGSLTQLAGGLLWWGLHRRDRSPPPRGA